MKAPLALAALAVLAALLAGGCSSSYAGADKDEFIAQGNAVCMANGATVKSGLEELVGGGQLATKAELRSFAGDVALPRMQERVTELRKLEPPSDDREDVDEIIRAYQAGIEKISTDPTQLADADPFLFAFSKAGAYGLSACAE